MRNGGGMVYVGFSGGKDSTVLLDLVRRIYPDVEAVFVDTGLEYPEIKSFVNTINNVTKLKPEMSFREVIAKYGYPVFGKETARYIKSYRKYLEDIKENPDTKMTTDVMKILGLPPFDSTSRYNKSRFKDFAENSAIKVSNICCDIMKKNPIHKWEKTNKKYPILGILTEESMLREVDWVHNGCNGFNMKRPRSIPLAFWTEQDILHYLKNYSIPYSPIYGDIVDEWTAYKRKPNFPTGKLITTGEKRTGCMYCLFGQHLSKETNLQRMAKTHPKIYDYCLRPFEQGGLGLEEVCKQAGIKYIPNNK